MVWCFSTILNPISGAAGVANNKANCSWKELENDTTAQEENMKQVLEEVEEDCVAVFTDGSALGNPGPTGAGAVIYMNGLQSDPISIKKGICSNGNNFLGEIVGIELAFKYLCDEAKIRNRDIHLFVDCQSAIVSAFGISIPNYKVDRYNIEYQKINLSTGK